MELAYLKKLYQDGLFDVYSGFDTWEEAVKAACSPLIRQGLVEPAYADSIIGKWDAWEKAPQTAAE